MTGDVAVVVDPPTGRRGFWVAVNFEVPHLPFVVRYGERTVCRYEARARAVSLVASLNRATEDGPLAVNVTDSHPVAVW